MVYGGINGAGIQKKTCDLRLRVVLMFAACIVAALIGRMNHQRNRSTFYDDSLQIINTRLVKLRELSLSGNHYITQKEVKKTSTILPNCIFCGVFCLATKKTTTKKKTIPKVYDNQFFNEHLCKYFNKFNDTVKVTTLQNMTPNMPNQNLF